MGRSTVDGAASPASTRREALRGVRRAAAMAAAAMLLGPLAGVVQPHGAAAKDDDDRDDRDEKRGDRRGQQRGPSPRPAGPTPALERVPARPPAQGPAPAGRAPQSPPPAPAGQPSLVAPQGTERMVSEPVTLTGVDGTGAGPVRVDVAGARPNSVYEVIYVPASNPALAVSLGTIQTDAAGAFHGSVPQPMPALGEAGRSGVLVIRWVRSI